MIRITDYKPKMFGPGWFFFHTFLTTVEFYKLYVDRYCKDQKFTIKKLLSTRANLIEAPEAEVW